jgi:uncharacterized membrane protein
MGIFNIFGKRDVTEELTKSAPYRLATEWVPYRLYSGKKSSSVLVIKLKNTTREPLLTSVVAELPKQLGFDTMSLSKEQERRLGDVAPGEERELKFEVYPTANADAGEYTVNLTAIAHYRDYGHVLNAVKKRVTVDVV